MHFLGPVGVVSAAAGGAVDQPAAHFGEIGPCAVVGVLELDQAALPASVADALPFGFRHLLQRLALPERNIVMRHDACLPEPSDTGEPRRRPAFSLHLVT